MGLFQATVLTLYPEMFPGPLGSALLQKAKEKGIWDLDIVNIRGFATDKHQTVDDSPFGGGAGMVLKPDVLGDTIDDVVEKAKVPLKKILLSPRGTLLTQQKCQSLSQEQGLLLLCGRFEGVDQRLIDVFDFDEISIGDYILMGGEVASMVLLESVVRLLPGVVGKEDSLLNESFALNLLEHSHYTRPAEWRGKVVPDVLRSGDHKKIAEYRLKESEQLTKMRRPDLWMRYQQKGS